MARKKVHIMYKEKKGIEKTSGEREREREKVNINRTEKITYFLQRKRKRVGERETE